VEQDTRERILQAARSLWREGGFAAVTTRAVAQRAGVNEVTLFRHFTNKDGLLTAMVESVNPLERAEPPADGPQDLVEDLRRWATLYVEHALPIADVIILGIIESRSHPELRPVSMRVPQRLHDHLTAHLEELARAGAIPRGPFSDIAWLFFGALFAHVVTSHLHPELDWERLTASAAETFAAALQHPSTAP
jgi:AcrR family transcriptional regulator